MISRPEKKKRSPGLLQHRKGLPNQEPSPNAEKKVHEVKSKKKKKMALRKKGYILRTPGRSVTQAEGEYQGLWGGVTMNGLSRRWEISGIMKNAKAPIAR